MLERVLQYPDINKLTHKQFACISPLKEEVRRAREALNLVMRAKVVFEGKRVTLYTHPDKTEDDSRMVYDRLNEEIFVQTPFTGLPDESLVVEWLETSAHQKEQ
jgi:hypothetical protein